jgi:ATP-dependent protease HslVU (ClpYQ) peptidase subunit
MEKIISILAAFAIALAANAQIMKEAEVPTKVKEIFKKSYSGAKEVQWEKESQNYEAKFEMGETDQSVLIDTNGTVLESEIEINISELPASSGKYVAEHYKGEKIKEAAKIMDSKGTVTYEAEINNKDLIFDSTGKFIKEEK